MKPGDSSEDVTTTITKVTFQSTPGYEAGRFQGVANIGQGLVVSIHARL